MSRLWSGNRVAGFKVREGSDEQNLVLVCGSQRIGVFLLGERGAPAFELKTLKLALGWEEGRRRGDRRRRRRREVQVATFCKRLRRISLFFSLFDLSPFSTR